MILPNFADKVRYKKKIWMYLHMEKNCLDANKVTTLTGTAVKDDESFKSEGGFVPERDQYYLELQQGDNNFYVGFKDMLICLRLLEKMEEIPPIGEKWWLQLGIILAKSKIMFTSKTMRAIY